MSLAGAQVWGLGRVAALEHPHRWGGLADLPAQFAERAGRRLCQVLAGGSGENQVAIRDQGVLARRLVRAPHGEAAAGPGNGAQPWRAHGTVLVTGGTGALGGHTARWLAGTGAGHLVLASRRGPAAPGAAALAAGLAAAGTAVTVTACDAASRPAAGRGAGRHPGQGADRGGARGGVG